MKDIRSIIKKSLLAFGIALSSADSMESTNAEGSAEDLFNQAETLYNGKEGGVGKNIPQACKYYRMAADQGHAGALNGVGDCYLLGEEKDLSEAMKYFHMSASKGDLRAQFNLGRLYHTGEAGEVDRSLAVKYYTIAAARGYADAKTALSKLRSVEQSIQPDSLSPFARAEQYYAGRGVPQDYEKALEYYRLAAGKGGSGDAYYGLAMCYYLGRGTQKNVAAAVKLFESASFRSYTKAHYMLGQLYETGEGVPKDLQKAEDYYMLAFEGGHPDAKAARLRVRSLAKSVPLNEDTMSPSALGDHYYQGKGVDRNYEKAVEYYRVGAEKGDADAIYGLGMCYYKGHGTAQNIDEAVKLFKSAAVRGNEKALYMLGQLYEKGEDVPKDLQKAKDYYEMAETRGHPDAKAARIRLRSVAKS